MKTIAEDIREMDYNIKLNREKISLQEKYISEVKQNKDKLVEEKTLESQVMKKRCSIVI